jgi:hypothetical protein
MLVWLWFYEDTDDDIQMENQSDIDCEDDDEETVRDILIDRLETWSDLFFSLEFYIYIVIDK